MNDMGWISLHRKMLNNEILKDDKLFKLWICLLLDVNHKTNNKVLFDSNLITVKRGQLITGKKKTSEKYGLSDSSFYRKLQVLSKLNMIKIENLNHRASLVTIINYDTYQSRDYKGETVSEPVVSQSRTSDEPAVSPTNNDNNDNNEKNENKKDFVVSEKIDTTISDKSVPVEKKKRERKSKPEPTLTVPIYGKFLEAYYQVYEQKVFIASSDIARNRKCIKEMTSDLLRFTKLKYGRDDVTEDEILDTSLSVFKWSFKNQWQFKTDTPTIPRMKACLGESLQNIIGVINHQRRQENKPEIIL